MADPSPPLVDIGVNLTHPAFDADRDEVLRAAGAAGVGVLVITGTDLAGSQGAADYAAECAARYPEGPVRCYATAGVHPHNAKDSGGDMPAALRELARRKEVVAIGECGLDYNRDYSPRNIQRRCFEAQLALARELSLPLFLHERDAFDDFFAILRGSPDTGPGSVVHCFTGTEGELRAYLDLGCYIGITGWICDERRGRHLAELVKAIPSDRLLLETDAPFLIPRDLGKKVRGGRNEPKYLPHIAGVVARYLGKPPEQVARETAENSRHFFRIP